MKLFNKIFTPINIYFTVVIIWTLYALFMQFPVNLIVINLFFTLIWSFIMWWLCKNGYFALSWFIVLLPYIIILSVTNTNILENNNVEGMSFENNISISLIMFVIFIGIICVCYKFFIKK